MDGMEKMVIVLRLAGGFDCLVDAKDEPLLRRHKWHLLAGNATNYAAAGIWRSGKMKTIRMHRLILDARPGQMVDHVNGNGLDNRRANLRLCSNAENKRNGAVRADSGSCYRGVHCRANGKWRAHIGMAGKRIWLGTFDTPEAAAHAYDRAALRLFGEFARPNLPPDSPEKAPNRG
jgi:hypothetical protein